MNRALIVVGVLVFLVYLFASITKDQITDQNDRRVDLVAQKLRAIVKAAENHYLPDVKNVDGSDPWSEDFQFARVDELWPDIFSQVVDPTNRPTDPFDPENGTFLAATQRNKIVVIGVGPNKQIDKGPGELEKWISKREFQLLVRGEWAYSATNGSKSAGDLYFLGEYKN